MKHFASSLLLFRLFCILTPAEAAPVSPEMTIEKIDNAFKMVRVTISGHQQPANILVTDYRQQIVLEVKAPSKQPFSKILDLSKLPSGTFFLSINTENKETLQPLGITPADVVLYEGRKMEFYAPTFKLKERQLDINWFNTQLSQFDISLSEWNGAAIFSKQLNNVIRVEKRFDLSKLPKGSYILTLKTPRKSWSHTIDLY
jgi:hypothetical protein